MKRFSVITESITNELLSKIKFTDGLSKETVEATGAKLGEKSRNAFYLTMMWATNTGDSEIVDDAKKLCSIVGNNPVEYVNNLLGNNDESDKTDKFSKMEDGSDLCTWVIYRTYVAKTIAKEDSLNTLDKCNLFLRSFKNSWEKSWAKIESQVKKMTSGILPELQNTETHNNELTNLEQAAAIDDAIDKENNLLDDLIKRAGINKSKLKEYVNIIINKSFKDSADGEALTWKKKVAANKDADTDFVLGIGAMVCGAIITGDKKIANDIFKYLEDKTQDDLKQAKKKMFK